MQETEQHAGVKRKAFAGVIWKLMERFIAQGVSLVVSIIIARILSPTEFSVVGIVTVFFNFANIIITSGLNTALIQKKDSDTVDYSTVLYTSLLLSLIIYGVLFFWAPWLAALYKIPELTIMIRVMGISLPIMAVKAVWCAYISSNLLFRRFFFATLGGTVFSGVVGVYMALNGFGAWALIAQQMSNTAIDTIILVLCTRVQIALVFSFSRLKRLFGYGWKIFASSLLGTTYSEVSPLVIGLKYSVNDLSFYTKGKSFPSMLATSATSTLASVMFPVMAKYQDDKERIRKYTRLFIRLSSFLCFSMMLGFFAVADNFVYVVLTEKWMPAVYYIRVFCLSYMFDVVAIGNCETIKAIGRSDVYLIIEIIKKAGYFITLFLFIWFSESAEILAIAYIVCTIISVVVNSIPNTRLINYSYADQLSDLAPNLAISVVMCLVTMYVGHILPKGLLALLAQIAAGVGVTVVICLITRNSAFFYFLDNLKRFMHRGRQNG